MKKDYKPIYQVYLDTFDKEKGEPVCYNEFVDNEIQELKKNYKEYATNMVKNKYEFIMKFEDFAINEFTTEQEEFLRIGCLREFDFNDLMEYNDYFENLLSIDTNLDKFMDWRYNTKEKCENCGKEVKQQYRFTNFDDEDNNFYGLTFQDCKREFDKAVKNDKDCRCSIYNVTICDCGAELSNEGVLFNTKCEEYKNF